MGETTELIRKRIRHTKTTLAGIATILGPIAATLWPEHAGKIMLATSALTGAGLIAAADASASGVKREE